MDTEIKGMVTVVREAVVAGAIGFSTFRDKHGILTPPAKVAAAQKAPQQNNATIIPQQTGSGMGKLGADLCSQPKKT